MTHTIDLIEQFKKSRGITSDYAAAKLLEVSQQSISNYRNGVSHADDRICIVIAREIGADPLQTIARVNIDRAKSEKDRAFWRSVINAAACALLYISAFSHSSAQAATTPKNAYSGALYIMSNQTWCSVGSQLPSLDHPTRTRPASGGPSASPSADTAADQPHARARTIALLRESRSTATQIVRFDPSTAITSSSSFGSN